MSLTSHLQRKQSPVRRFFDQIIDERAARELVRHTNDQAALAARERGGPLVVAGTEPMLAGAAFDFGFRAWVQPFSHAAPPRTARHGADNARQVGWPQAPALLDDIISTLPDADPLGQARRFVALAVVERFARALGAILARREDGGDDLPTQMLADQPATLTDLLARMPEATVRDVAAILEDARQRWPTFRDQPFVPNPSFPLSAQIGGADADWVSGGVLYECKVSYQPRPVEGAHLRQLLGYLLLDTEDALALRAVALLLPRQGAHIAWDIPDYLRLLRIAGDLPELRRRFAAVVTALPAPQRSVEHLTVIDLETGRKRQVLRVRVPRRSPPPDADPS